jgi:bifunctional ADP-heptose synthase (sugar kinase/adenylyltransferase)
MKKVLVIGDSCIDMFRYGVCKRLCPEAPVPVFNPTKTICNGGMCINVHENLKALSVHCEIITNDIRPVKTRYVDEVSNQMLIRVDEIDNVKRILKENLEKIDFKKYSAIVVSDYNKGFLTEEDIKYITDNHNCVFLDTKKKIAEWSFGVEFIKINKKEFDENSEFLLKEYSGDLIVTLGKEGAMHWMNNYLIKEEHDVRDLSGAGDTFLASFVAKYLETKKIGEAIEFANKCASWVVSQKGVVVVDPNEIH